MGKAVMVATFNESRNYAICTSLTERDYVALQAKTPQEVRRVAENGLLSYRPTLYILSPMDPESTTCESATLATELKGKGLSVVWVSGQKAPAGIPRVDPANRNYRRKLINAIHAQIAL